MKQQPKASGFCVACGSRNVAQHAAKANAGGPLVQCRSCGVVSPDFNQRQPREGVRPGFEPLDRASALAMADQVLDALDRPAVRQRLHDALDAAQGDVASICHTYLPVALDVIARVVSAFGFAAGLEGVAASVEALQTLARDDVALVQRVVALRKALTPTGDWIREDREAELLDQRRLEQQQAEQQRREQDERLAAAVAARNAALARLRAKKLALGLDPSAARLPELRRTPAPVIAALEGDCVRLRVDVRFSRRRQWFFNGAPIADDDARDPAPLRRGARGCTLTLPRMSRRVAGEYFCVCENDEGSAVTPVTRVQLVDRLRADRLAEWPAPPTSQHAAPTVMRIDGDDPCQVVAVCVPTEPDSGGSGSAFSVALMEAETLAPVRLAPPIRTSGSRPAIAWSNHANTLAVVSDATPAAERSKSKNTAAKPAGAVDIALFSIGRSTSEAAGQPARAPNAPNTNSDTAAGGSSMTAQRLATQTVALAGVLEGGVRAVAFMDCGRLLALTDLRRSVAVYALNRSRSLQLLQTVCSTDGERVDSVAAAADAPVVALTFRNAPHMDVVRWSSPPSGTTDGVGGAPPPPLAITRRHQLALAARIAAVDRAGLFAAVAEAATCLKSWVSVVNLRTRDRSVAASDAPLRSKRRFEAHVGAVTGLQWTDASSLLLSSGLDGFVKLWDVSPPSASTHSGVGAAMLAQFHVGESVLRMAFARHSSTLVTVAKARRAAPSAAIQARALPQLKELEAFRREQQIGEAAVRVQRVWKGHQTRVLLAELLCDGHQWRRRSAVGRR